MAVVAALAVAGIVAASYLSLGVLVAAVCLVTLVVGIGWPHLLGVPARKTLAAVITLSGLAAVAAAALAPAASLLMWLPMAAALGVAAVFVVQLLRGTGQSHRLESTLGASTGVLLAAMGSGWVAADRLAANASNSGMMLVTGLGMLTALAVCEIPWPDRIVAPVAVVLAGLAGVLAALLFAPLPPRAAGAGCAGAAAVLASFRRLVVAGDGPDNWPAALSVGAAPVLGIGALVYFIDKLLLG